MLKIFSKFMIISILALISCQPKAHESKTFLADPNPIQPKSSSAIALQTEKDLVDLSTFQWLGDEQFAILDKFVTHQAFVFNLDGSLVCELGRKGQGPGEYRAPTGVAVHENRLFLTGVDGKLNIYQKDHCEFLDFYFLKSQTAISKGLYALPGDQFMIPVFSRHAKHSLYIINATGTVVKAFSKTEPIFGAVFDTLPPQGGVLVHDNRIYQFFNHRYALKVFSLQGKQLKSVQLASSIYSKPDFKKAKGVRGIQQEQAFRATFTQFIGFYRLGDGWATVLRNWTDQKSYEDIVEFWDASMTGKGRFSVPGGEIVVATKESAVIFFHVGSEKTQLIFREFELR